MVPGSRCFSVVAVTGAATVPGFLDSVRWLLIPGGESCSVVAVLVSETVPSCNSFSVVVVGQWSLDAIASRIRYGGCACAGNGP